MLPQGYIITSKKERAKMKAEEAENAYKEKQTIEE